MAIKTLQVTLTGAVQQISAVRLKVQWATFQNNAVAVMRVGDASVSATQGYSLAATGGALTVPLQTEATFGTDLSQWFVIGTATQVLDIICDTMNF
jgi:hypothetical protein